MTFPTSVTWLAPTEVILFFETIKVCNCLYCGKFAGMCVSVLLLKSRTATGVVAGMLFTMDSIFESSIPLFAQFMVSVVVLPLVAPQTHGAISAAYVGH